MHHETLCGQWLKLESQKVPPAAGPSPGTQALAGLLIMTLSRTVQIKVWKRRRGRRSKWICLHPQ
eukprot:5547500-Karenia_brevis.AAC.1